MNFIIIITVTGLVGHGILSTFRYPPGNSVDPNKSKSRTRSEHDPTVLVTVTLSVGRIGKLSPLDSPGLRNSVDQIPFFNLRRSMNRDLRRLGGASAQRSSLSQPSKLVVGMDAASSREDRRNWFGFRAISRLPRRKCENSFRRPWPLLPPPLFTVRSFGFFFGNVFSFSSPTTSGRSFLEQGPEESVFFPTQFLFFFFRDSTSLVSEHSLCLFPWRFWFFSLFYFVHFGLNETNET